MNTLAQFCSNPNCPACGHVGQGNIVIHGGTGHPGQKPDPCPGGGEFTHAPPGREIGILAGNRSLLGLGHKFWGIEEPNDGTIALSETYLDGAKAHHVLPVVHMGLLFSEEASRMMHRFLATGRF